MPVPVIFLLLLFAQAKPTNRIPPEFRGPYRPPPLLEPYKATFGAVCGGGSSLQIEQKRVPDGWRVIATVPLQSGPMIKPGEIELAGADTLTFLFLLLDGDSRKQLGKATKTIDKAELKDGIIFSIEIRGKPCVATINKAKGEA